MPQANIPASSDRAGATPKLAGVRACLFDAYGTLFDFASAAARCPDIPQAQRAALTALWRDKQLQYTWLRTLQGRYVDFWRVTGDALDFALDSLGLESAGLRARLMDLYRSLAAYPEVPAVLKSLRAAGYVTAILSNGSPAMLADATASAGLGGLIDAALSVDAVGAYKTHPSVYAHALERLGLGAAQIAFVSANGWDAYAASDFGLRVVWCNRARQPPERLPGAPEVEIATLAELPALLGARV